MRRRLPTRHTQRGYNAVEVMMAITLVMVGSIGVMAMQQASIQGNKDAREMDVATAIAHQWLERLERDSALWTPSIIPVVPPANLPSAVLLNENITGQWYVPKTRLVNIAPQDDVESAGFDMLAQDMDNLTGAGLRYCVNLRLTPLTTDQTLIRAEVRVFWPRNLAMAPDPNYCNQAPPASLDIATTQYHFVYAVTAVRQNVQP